MRDTSVTLRQILFSTLIIGAIFIGCGAVRCIFKPVAKVSESEQKAADGIVGIILIYQLNMAQTNWTFVLEPRTTNNYDFKN
jgi:hypothetical protein